MGDIRTFPRDVFRSRVKAARDGKGLSQQQLAERLSAIGYAGLDRTKLAKIESGSRNVSIDEMLAIAAALNVAPVHLLAPLQDDAVVALGGQTAVSAVALRNFIRGAQPLLPGAPAFLDFIQESPTSEIEQSLGGSRDYTLADLMAGRLAPMPAQAAEDLSWELTEGQRKRRTRKKDGENT